jgi:hypothetical protein
MKTAETTFDRAIKEVRDAKVAVYEDTKDLSPEEVYAYFRCVSENFAREFGKRWVKNANGTSSLR